MESSSILVEELAYLRVTFRIKRQLSDPRYESIKKSILENEVKKVEIFKAIESTGHDESNSNMFCRLSVANFV